jgi:hypothetical protein
MVSVMICVDAMHRMQLSIHRTQYHIKNLHTKISKLFVQSSVIVYCHFILLYAPDGGGWSTPCTGRCTPWKDLVRII